jgi:hypothetical protein
MAKKAAASSKKGIVMMPSTISIISATSKGRDDQKFDELPEAAGVHFQNVAFTNWIKTRKDVDFGEFMNRWATLKDQIGTMIADLTKQTFGKMTLDEVEVSIAVSGEGSIGIATAKGEASIVLTFKNPKSSA